MLEFIMSYGGTIVVLLLLAAIVAFVIYRMVKDKKQGKSSCGNNCAHCACAGACHNNAVKKKR